MEKEGRSMTYADMLKEIFSENESLREKITYAKVIALLLECENTEEAIARLKDLILIDPKSSDSSRNS